MKNRNDIRAIAAALLFLLACTGIAAARDYTFGGIVISHPYAFASIGKVPNGAGFVAIRNDGDQDDALIGVASEFAKRNELHTHIHQNGRMMMRPLKRIEVPAGSTVKLEPGGDHIMLMGLDGPLKSGEKRPLTLIFEKAGELRVELVILERE